MTNFVLPLFNGGMSHICSQNWICADLGCTAELGSYGTPAVAINSSTLSNCIVQVKFTIHNDDGQHALVFDGLKHPGQICTLATAKSPPAVFKAMSQPQTPGLMQSPY